MVDEVQAGYDKAVESLRQKEYPMLNGTPANMY